MPVEYEIEELAAGGAIWRDSKPTRTEAETEAAKLRETEHKNFAVIPRYIPDEGEPVELLTAERLFAGTHAPGMRLEDQPLKLQLLLELMADTANEVFAEHLPEAGQILKQRGTAR